MDPIRCIYVHAPFCARRCYYCDFAVAVDAEGDAGAWVKALSAELVELEPDGRFTMADQLETLYVGGGTPSLLGPDAMRLLADLFGAPRLSAPDLEWTAEANPESFRDELAGAWLESGVNRVSLGVQSFHEPTLRWMGRLHGSDGARRAVTTAQRVGFTNISLDLIFGLPAGLARSWGDDLDRAIELEVPHVSLYGLSVEAGTPLGRAVAGGQEAPADEEQYRDEFLVAAERLTAAGYEHYEVSNFARDGLASRHNSAYWDGRPYLGLGNGAHSYRHPIRRWNVREWEAYRARAFGGAPVEQNREELTAEATALEQIWLGLRTSKGLELDGLSQGARELADDWERRGLAELRDDRVRLSALGWLQLDGLAVAMDAVASKVSRVSG